MPPCVHTQAAATAWMSAWLAGSTSTQQRAFFQSALALMGSKEVSRQGLLQGMRILGGCASSAGSLEHAADKGAWAGGMLSMCQDMLQHILQHHGTAFKTEVHGCLLEVLCVAAPVSVVGTTSALRFVQQLPQQATAAGGALNTQVKAYLLGIEAASPATSDAAAAAAVAAGVTASAHAEAAAAANKALAQLVEALEAVAPPAGAQRIGAGDLEVSNGPHRAWAGWCLLLHAQPCS